MKLHTWRPMYEGTTNQHCITCDARRSRRYRNWRRLRYWVYLVTMGPKWFCE